MTINVNNLEKMAEIIKIRDVKIWQDIPVHLEIIQSPIFKS